MNVFLILVLLVLMGAAPLLAWRRSAPETLRRNFTVPVIAGILSVPALWLVGNHSLAGFVGLSVLAFVLAGIVQEFVRGVRTRGHATGEGPGRAFLSLLNRNGRRYGGYIVHIGVLMIALGIIGNEFYQSEGQANLKVGESVTVANYTLTYRDLEARQGPNYTEFVGVMDVQRNGRPDGQILAKKLIYNKNQEQPMTEVGLRPGLIEDVYVVLAGFDSMGATASFKVYVNPLMSWMWIGGLVIILGVLIATWPRAAYAAARARAPVPGSRQSVA